MYFSSLFVWCEAKFVGLFLRSFRFFVSLWVFVYLFNSLFWFFPPLVVLTHLPDICEYSLESLLSSFNSNII